MGRPKGSPNKPKETMVKTVVSPFEGSINKLKLLLDVIRGKEDARERFSFLFQPEEERSTSNLTPAQAEFCEDARLTVKHFPRFQALADLAHEILITTPSIKGKRVEDAINFQRASKGQTGTQVGIFPQLKEKITGKKGDRENA